MSVFGGSHSAGSNAPFALLDEALTATRASSALAKASRVSAGHSLAPDSHASARWLVPRGRE